MTPWSWAAIPESWRATQQGLAGALLSTFPLFQFVHSGYFWYHPEGFGHGWARREWQHPRKSWGCGMREPYPFGAMYLSQKGTGAWLQHVLYKPQDSVRMTVIFCCFGFFFFILTSKIANLLTSSVSTAGCVKGRVRRRAVNRIKAWAFTSLVSCPWESCCEMWNLWQPWLLQSRSNEH